MTHDEALAEIAQIEAELARRSLLNFTCYTKRDYVPNWHHKVIANSLDQALAGQVMRVMYTLPPQNGKSELISRKFPAYVLGRFPDWRLVGASYNSDLAVDMGRDVQRVMSTAEYRVLFPQTRLGSEQDDEERTAQQFRVVGRDGGYKSVGVGSGLTGRPMDLGIIDDPVKDRAEAESETYRKRVWDWYTAVFSTRQRHARVPFVMATTRWHEDDLAGRLLARAKEDPLAEQWAVVSFPAVCERERPSDPRKVGEALWPDRYPIDWLRKQEVLLQSYDWASLYQQSPVPAGGAMFKREWFRRYEVLAPGNVIRRLRCWDIAATVATAGRDPDWTVGTLVAELVGGLWMVEHVVRGRWSPNEVDNLMLQTAVADGKRVPIRELREGGSSGKAVIAAHTRMLAGWDYAEWRGGSKGRLDAKTIEWTPFARQVEAGNVVLPMGDVAWLRAWLDEMCIVPYGPHDDQADSVAGAFNALMEYKPKKKAAASILPGGATVLPAVRPLVGR